MSKYLNVLYGTDTYGIRVRTEISLTATCVDYGLVKLVVGPIPPGYRTGSRIVISRSDKYWPRPPLYKDKYPITDPPTMPPDPYSLHYGAPYHEDWDETILAHGMTGTSLYGDASGVYYDNVRPDSVVYYRAYVTEPLAISDPATAPLLIQQQIEATRSARKLGKSALVPAIWSPWEVRGQVYCVGVGDHGGRRTTFDSFPNGILTGGEVYGINDEDSVQSQFISAIGWMSDTVSTDGALIIDQIEHMHPNMVLPLLRGFGLKDDEELAINAQYSTWDAEFENPGLKNLLFRYRDLTLKKGTAKAITGFLHLALGLPRATVSQPENLVLTVTDASPKELFDPSAAADVQTLTAAKHGLTKASIGQLYQSVGHVSWRIFDVPTDDQVQVIAHTVPYDPSVSLPAQGTLTRLPVSTVHKDVTYTATKTTRVFLTDDDLRHSGHYLALSGPGEILHNSTVTVLGEGAEWSRQPTWNSKVAYPLPAPHAGAWGGGIWSDISTRGWSLGPQDNLIPDTSSGATSNQDVGGAAYLPPVIKAPNADGTRADSWGLTAAEEEFYTQYTEFVYQILVPNGETVTLGSVEKEVTELSLTGVPTKVMRPDFERAMVIRPADVDKYSIRCRLLKQRGGNVTATFTLNWLDRNGFFISSDTASAPVIAAQTGWVDVSTEGLSAHGVPPVDARYATWKISLSATAEAVVAVGAIQVGWTDLRVITPYRNPRSVVILVDYDGKSPTWEQRIGLAKAETLVKEWVPANVDYRFIDSVTNAGPEWDGIVKPGVPGVPPQDLAVYDDTKIAYADTKISYDQYVHPTNAP